MKRLVLAFTLIMAWMTSGAHAVPLERGRVAWFSSQDKGYFVQDAVSGVWSETINAVESFYFKELSRNNDYVQLFDASRNMSVRLYGDSMLLKGAGDAQYRTFKNGYFDGRRMFYYTNAAGEAGYFQLIGGEMYRKFVRNGTQTSSTYLRVMQRQDDQLRLLDPRANLMYTIYETQEFKGLANGGVLYLDNNGSWR